MLKRTLKRIVPKQVLRIWYMKYCPIFLPWFYKRNKKFFYLHKIELQKARYFRTMRGENNIIFYIEMLFWPLITFGYAIKNTLLSSDGKYVKDTKQLSLSIIFFQQLWISQRFNIHPMNYYLFRLYEPENFKNIHNYFIHPLLSGLIEEVNNNTDTTVLSNKVNFASHCIKYNLPTIKIYALANNGKLKWCDKRFSDYHLPTEDLFIKPVDSELLPYGRGAESLKYNNGNWKGKRGRYTKSDFIEHIEELSKTTDYIIMPVIKNSQNVTHLTSGALSSIRIVTLLYNTGEIKPITALLRMPVNDMDVDNAGSGGMFAGIDLAGTIGTGFFNDIKLGEHVTHPDTGIKFQGTKYPFFFEVLELCSKAHMTLPYIKSIGWDIALTENGLTIIEGNNNWGEPGPEHPPLGLSEFPEWASSILSNQSAPFENGITCR